MYFLYSQVLINRVQDYLRSCFVDNGIDEMDGEEWETYKREQVRLIVSKCKSLMDVYNTSCLRVFHRELYETFVSMMFHAMEKELSNIFENGRNVSLDYKKTSNASIREFKDKLNKILNCKTDEMIESVGIGNII